MILAIDIGNTNTSIGLFRGRRLVRALAVPTERWRRGKGPRLRGVRGAEQAIICSVVPWATPRVSKALRLAGVRSIRVVGRDVKVPLKNRYAKPRQVGQDRLVGAYAAWKQFGEGQGAGGQGRDCIVVDIGTAVTIDVVTRRGEYLGGVIAPGLEFARDALGARAALLPVIRLPGTVPLLGRDTASSIRAGLIRGTAALCEGLASQLKQRYAPKAQVILTGGSAALLRPYFGLPHRACPTLVLDGLQRLAAK